MNSDLSGLKPIYRSRLLVIQSLIHGYDGSIPFHQYLNYHFSKNRNYGAADRRLYRSWCYAWFRMGKAIPETGFFTRLSAAYYLVNGSHDDFSREVIRAFVGEDLSDISNEGLNFRLEKFGSIFPDFNLHDIFPFDSPLSAAFDRVSFAHSMLIQPKVFIRVVKGKMETVMNDCRKFSIPFESDSELPQCMAFEASVKLENLPSREKGYFEIQDRSSQIAGNAIPVKSGEWWWDCCCGAGGKSLLLIDTIVDIRLTASDKRESVLKNFSERLKKAGQPEIEMAVVDFDAPLPGSFKERLFDGIIADVPCSGSGTWARTPENLSHFISDSIPAFQERQKSIVLKSVTCLKPQGLLVYITCSVFRMENEDMASWIASLPGMKLLLQQCVAGFESRSDSMFYAVFEKVEDG